MCRSECTKSPKLFIFRLKIDKKLRGGQGGGSRGPDPPSLQQDDSRDSCKSGSFAGWGGGGGGEERKDYIVAKKSYRLLQQFICIAIYRPAPSNQSINQFFNYRNVKTHFHMRKTQSSKIYIKSVNTYHNIIF